MNLPAEESQGTRAHSSPYRSRHEQFAAHITVLNFGRFRRKFYREILPWLKQQEKTVVAVTHDDDHYEVADRVLKMQFGSFV